MELEKRKEELLSLMDMYELLKIDLMDKANKMTLFGNRWEKGIGQWDVEFNKFFKMAENGSFSKPGANASDFAKVIEEATAFKNETTRLDWEISSFYTKAKRVTDVFKGMNAEKKIVNEKLKEMRHALASSFPEIMKDADAILERCEAYQHRFVALAKKVETEKPS